MWHECSSVLRLQQEWCLALPQPHPLPWSKEEYARSRGKCPPQAHPPLLDHYQVVETSEFLALAVSAKTTSILLKAEYTSLYRPLSPRRAACRGWEQNLDVRAGESTHACTILLMVWMGPGVGREGRQAGASSPCTTMVQQRSLGVRILNSHLAFQVIFQGRIEYILFNILIPRFVTFKCLESNLDVWYMDFHL